MIEDKDTMEMPEDDRDITEKPVSEETPASPPPAWRIAASWVRELLETLLPAIVIALLINIFLAQATRVYGQSMEPTLHTDQRLIVEKISYHLHGPRRGDIVVLKMPQHSEELLIKRVIGLPGEKVEIHDGKVYIDGVPLDEPYLTQPTQGYMPAVTVPPLHVFVLGDNRMASNDSRTFGPVPIDNIVGKAWLSYWPPRQVQVFD